MFQEELRLFYSAVYYYFSCTMMDNCTLILVLLFWLIYMSCTIGCIYVRNGQVYVDYVIRHL